MKLLHILFLLLFVIPAAFAASKTTRIYVTSDSANNLTSIYDEDQSLITTFDRNANFVNAQYFFQIDYNYTCAQTNSTCDVTCSQVTCPTLPAIPSCPACPENVLTCPVIPDDRAAQDCIASLDKKLNPEKSEISSWWFAIPIGLLLWFAWTQFKNYKSARPVSKPIQRRPEYEGYRNNIIRRNQPSYSSEIPYLKRPSKEFINQERITPYKEVPATIPPIRDAMPRRPFNSAAAMKELDRKIQQNLKDLEEER